MRYFGVRFLATLRNVDPDVLATSPAATRLLYLEAEDEADAIIQAVIEARRLVVYRLESVEPAAAEELAVGNMDAA